MIKNRLYLNRLGKLILPIMFFLSGNNFSFSQVYNRTWLLGTDPGLPMGRINFTSSSNNLLLEQRKMSFKGTQGNISNINGNFLMSSNGVWIANATGDTMQNGSGLNPAGITSNWPLGLPLPGANLIVPAPGDSNKYYLFHHTATYDGTTYPSFELFYSIIDLSSNNGLGLVIQKNVSVIQDTLIWGIAACKHANGRDWWIIIHKDESDLIYKILLTDVGITSITSQQLNINTSIWATVTQFVFSPDGKKFAYTNSFYSGGNYNLELRLLDFNRCSGNFSNPQVINLDFGIAGSGISFSPSSQYLYCSSFQKIFQLNTDTADIAASLKTVAINDGFYSPSPPYQTDFWLMYLAANGKIYITSGSSVSHHHYINYPDLGDTLCDVVQHGLDLNGIRSFRAVPNHPNYYLGCDTTLGCGPCLVSVNEIEHDFKFNIYPNPSSGIFNIIYLLPQNKEGKLEVFDITGKVVYEMRLPQWSTLQHISLPKNLSNGIYSAIIKSDNMIATKKLVILRE